MCVCVLFFISKYNVHTLCVIHVFLWSNAVDFRDQGIRKREIIKVVSTCCRSSKRMSSICTSVPQEL